MRAKLIDQKRSGLWPEHDSIAPLMRVVRATIPVLDALRGVGATTEPMPRPKMGWKITPGSTMPTGIVAVHVNADDVDIPCTALRLESEPPWPQEFPDYWAEVDWLPCPVCAAPVIWYEAGYVPGYRVCTENPHHHSLAG